MSDCAIQYIADASVDAGLDRELRELLASCFTKSGGEVFRERRYWREMPQHRWIIRAPSGPLIAHVAVHDKTVVVGGAEHRIGGIAEVCVLPEHRGRGHVKKLLTTVHDWLRAQGIAYAVLFGEPKVYTSSGYRVVTNLSYDKPDAVGNVRQQKAEGAMVASLGDQPWPDAPVFLPGGPF